MVSTNGGQYHIGMSQVDPFESGRTKVPRIDAAIAGMVRSALVVGNICSSSAVACRTLMLFVVILFAPGSHCAWCCMMGAGNRKVNAGFCTWCTLCMMRYMVMLSGCSG
jgi:hypothetical protein